MLEHLTTNDLIRIANAGGGFVTKAGFRPIEDLIRIANAAGKSGANLTFLDLAHLNVNDLVRIGNAGKGNVIFRKDGE